MKENHLTRGRKLEVRWRLEVGALLVLVKPRMLASPHADIPAMEELYTSQLSPGLCRLQSGAILLVEILSSVL